MKDRNDDLPWMSEEQKNQSRLRDAIVANDDIDALFELEGNVDFSIGLHEMLVRKYDNAPESLNSVELNLFLCMHLENAGQAGHILNFLHSWFPQYSREVIDALREIGAIQSSYLIKLAVAVLPKDGSWFFDVADDNEEAVMSKIDSEFSNYPDGSLMDLYRRYAERNRSVVLKNKP